MTGVPGAGEGLFEPRRVPAGERALGRFRLLHELGAGGMATLFLATDELGRLVAIKRLHPHLAAEQRFVEMFSDEAAIAARIRHHNVCQVHGLERHGGQLFIVMEYVHGESLAALQEQHPGPLPVEVAAHLLGQACLGLHAAHTLADDDGRSLHVVHRDVSPRNLLVTYDGELKVVDFGIAAAASKLHQTETGTVKGTVAYSSPEQLRGQPVDGRGDIFALGAVLYEAVCGARCFQGRSLPETIAKIQTGTFRPPRELRPDLPPALEAMILQALAARPERRQPSAVALYRQLYDLLAAAPGGMTARAISDRMRRVFAQRYALREQMLSLAFAAPDVLEEEELTLELAEPGSAHRCEFCAKVLGSDAALQEHVVSCSQRQWWEHNFGTSQQDDGVGDIQAVRQHAAEREPELEVRGLWSRLRERLSRAPKKDPLVLRLERIQARLDSVRHYRAEQLSDRAMVALWRMVELINDKSPDANSLLGRLKPRLVRCANLLLGVTLELEANADYLSSTSDSALKDEIGALVRRLEAAPAGELTRELELNIRRKRGLQAERQRLVDRNKLLLLRLESMVAAVELTHGKVLRISNSPVVADSQATTQITVFLDSLLLEVEQLARSVQETEGVG
jgi:serine/threonine-protein kinase